MPEIRKPKIFISYSHRDEKWKDFIRTFLDGEIFEVWDDRDIELGSKWYEVILEELNSCDIALLLVSRYFLQSEFIKQNEIPVFLKRCEEDNVKVIYLIISSCGWKHYDWVESVQGYPKDNKPLNSFQEQKNISFDECPKIETEVQNFVDKILSNSIAKSLQKEHKVLANYNENNYPNDSTKENILSNTNKKTNNIFLHFRQDKLDDNKYFVDIYARYKEIHLNKTYRDVVIEDINSQESQQKLMEFLHQFRKKIPIHLIVPSELYLENFRLWKGNKTLKGLFHPIYLHSDTRYSQDVDEYNFMIEDEWRNEYSPDVILKDALEPIETLECEYDITTQKIGVCFKYHPTEEKIDEHLDIAKIALWFNKQSNDYQTWLKENCDTTKLNELPDKLIKCNHASLLWDDMSMLVDLKKELQG